MKTGDKNNRSAFIQHNYFIPKITLRGICWVSVKLTEQVLEGDFAHANPPEHYTSTKWNYVGAAQQEE